MNPYRLMLEQVRDLKLKKDELPSISYEQETELLQEPVVINRQHVIHVLKRFKQERLSQEDLYDWVHFVWFSDFYTCEDDDADSIASVMQVLEELEEEGDLTPDDADYCLQALEKNEIAESLFGEEI
jgi:hypothetical protein